MIAPQPSKDGMSTRESCQQPLAVALFNDTGSAHHTGCLAVSQAHRAMLARAGAIVRHAHFVQEFMFLGSGTVAEGIARVLASDDLLRVFADVDAVVVNGEGTIHDVCGRHLLAILGAAQHLGLPTFLVNAVLQDIEDGREVLLAVDDCTVREGRTARYLQSLGIPHRIVVDSIFEADFVATPRHDFTGKLIVTDCHARRAGEFASQFDDVRRQWGAQVAEYPLQTAERAHDWQHAVADFAPALAVVTGRHHGACVALRAGVPFVTFPSNTWKIEGVLEMLDGYPPEAADLSRPIAERLAAAIEAREWFRQNAAAWDRRGKLDTFAGLQALRLRQVRRRLAISAATSSRGLDDRALAAIRALTRRGGNVLHAGTGDGSLVRSLIAEGIDAHGLEVSTRAADALNARLADRFFAGAPEALPFADAAFSVVIADPGWLEHLEAEPLRRALAELARVSADVVIVETTGRPLRGEAAAGVIRSREWWEPCLFDAGLRRHAAFVESAGFEAIESETAPARLIMQKLPATAAALYPRPMVVDDGDLHTDLLRETGQRSDLSLSRYEWARQWIAAGDVVIDAGCSLGYGATVLRDRSDAAQVIGLDNSESAIRYARNCFVSGRHGLAFQVVDVESWAGWADASVDCIVAFETIDRLSNPDRFLREVQRVLKPGGRFLASVANARGGTSLDDLCDLVGGGLLVDQVYAQSAGSRAAGFQPLSTLRQAGWRPVEPTLRAGAESWLVTAFKDSLALRPLLLGDQRVRSPRLRQALGQRWLDGAPAHSADVGAVLSVLAYCAVDAAPADGGSDLLARIAAYHAHPFADTEVLRSRVSLAYVEGLWHMHRGDLAEAERSFNDCASLDTGLLPPPLAEKKAEAAWLARQMSRARGEQETAARLAAANAELSRRIEVDDRDLVARDTRIALLEAALESAHVPTWIWGAGAGGERLLRWFRARRAHVAGVIDSQPTKIGGLLLGVPVVSPQTFRAAVISAADARLIIASIHHEEIRTRVRELDIPLSRPVLAASVEL